MIYCQVPKYFTDVVDLIAKLLQGIMMGLCIGVHIATQKKAHVNVIVSILYGIKAVLASFGSVQTDNIIIKRELTITNR